MVIIPASQGDVGLLPGHAPLASALRPGVISILRDNTVVSRVFVPSGFFNISTDCDILVDDAQEVETLDQAQCRQQLSEAGSHPEGLAIAEARLAAASGEFHYS